MKVFHNKALKIQSDITDELGLECYVPSESVIIEMPDGRRVRKTRPAIAGLLFVSAPADFLRSIKMLTLGNAMFYTSADGTPAAIPSDEMAMFRFVTSLSDNGLEYLPASTGDYRIGQHVKVLGGPFEGAEGHICRIKGNRRLVVSINGVCAVATSYIPACFLKKIP